MYYQKLIRILITVLLSQVVYSLSVYATEREKYLFFTDVNGLPRNITTCIEQDKYGYTWIGTGNGIARYDGNAFLIYDQFKGVNINHLLIDSENNLWVASDQGIYYYNRLTNFFELITEEYIRTIQEDAGDIYFLTNNSIQKLDEQGIISIKIEIDFRDFCITEEGIWYSNSYDGAKLLSRQSGFSEITENYIDGKYVSVIREIDGNLFFGCRNGQLFVRKTDGSQMQIAIENHYVFQEIVKVGTEIWMATDGNGIIILDSDLNYLRSLNKSPNQGSKLCSNSIYDIYLGSNNEIWIATYGAGLICLQYDESPFKNIIPEPGNKNSLVGKEGVSVFTNNNKIYFGTNYGLSILDENSGKFVNFPMSQMKKDLQGTKVLAFNTDKQNNYWVGTYDGLLGKYSPGNTFIQSYNPCSDSENEMQRIILLHNYNNTNLLIGTHYRDKSLLNFDFVSETFTPIKINFGGERRTHFQIISIRENKNGEVQALLRNMGLYTINPERNILLNNLPEINKRVTFRINDFYHDKKGFYWFATQKNGLIRMSVDGREFDKWTMEQGLPTNSLLRIESVDDEYLWISTIAGLCRFEMETGQVSIFNHRHGLPANEFSPRASAKTPDGRLIFGSNAGFSILDLQKVNPDTSKTEVIISDITFHNQSIKRILNNPYLSVPLEETRQISLPFNRNSFTIHFFSKDKNLPKYNNYAYRLTGMENEWIYLGETKHTTYTNLSPGNYTFEVKSTNKSNVWSHVPTRLTIRINPPWYLTWYAYVGYAALFLITLFGSLYIYTNRVHMKKEVEISEFKVQKEHELTEKKLAFFTNISHDLKTPLTLINVPVHDLLQSEKLDDEQRNKLEVIRRNSKRLYKLITDLIDFRKLTQKQLPLLVRETDIPEVVENIFEAFKEECRNKSIDFEYFIKVEKPAFVDAKKVEKILWNLLSNAIKFTDNDGEIFLSVEEINQDGKLFLKFLVKDSGRGILKKDIDRIFDRFYQTGINRNMPNEGTGIGLSIVKDLVELHHGVIMVESEPGVGSNFIVTIPVQKEHYNYNELDIQGSTQPLYSEPDIYSNTKSNISDKLRHEKYNLPKILLVEDNVELREYLADHFNKNFKVYQAEDGEKGYKCAKEKNPDIIVTDILMPNMNGYEFCKKVRNNFEISHIPVVMLTANSAIEKQIEGLSTGADAYVTKPFDMELLDTVLNSVLLNRKMLREKFLGIESLDDQENKLTQKDIDFIRDLKLYIEENIATQALNIELLSKHFAISRTQLNRKIKSLVGKTPNNLIRSIRLNKSYELIKKQGVRVSEAAYMTGFSDPNYFTICFKKEFGENPSKIN